MNPIDEKCLLAVSNFCQRYYTLAKIPKIAKNYKILKNAQKSILEIRYYHTPLYPRLDMVIITIRDWLNIGKQLL